MISVSRGASDQNEGGVRDYPIDGRHPDFSLVNSQGDFAHDTGIDVPKRKQCARARQRDDLVGHYDLCPYKFDRRRAGGWKILDVESESRVFAEQVDPVQVRHENICDGSIFDGGRGQGFVVVHGAIPLYSRLHHGQTSASTHHFTLISKNSGDAPNLTGTGTSSYGFEGAPSFELFSSATKTPNTFAAKFNAASSEPFKSATVVPLPLKKATTTFPSLDRVAFDEKNVFARRIITSVKNDCGRAAFRYRRAA